jgi:starch phosphorylase
MPVQIIIAGKAHPADDPGKHLITASSRPFATPNGQAHVFIEDYDIEVGRELGAGVSDLWLNNPRRGEEACAAPAG